MCCYYLLLCATSSTWRCQLREEAELSSFGKALPLSLSPRRLCRQINRLHRSKQALKCNEETETSWWGYVMGWYAHQVSIHCSCVLMLLQGSWRVSQVTCVWPCHSLTYKLTEKTFCRSLIKVKFSTDQFRSALGSGCCLIDRLSPCSKNLKIALFQTFSTWHPNTLCSYCR